MTDPHFRTIGAKLWPPAAMAKGVAMVPQRKQGEVRAQGGTQALDIRQTGQVATYQKVRVVLGPKGLNGPPMPSLPESGGLAKVRQVKATELKRYVSAQRVIVQAAQGEPPSQRTGSRTPAGVGVRVMGQPNAVVAPNAALRAIPVLRVRKKTDDKS